MNIRFIIAFSFLMCLFVGSAAAMQQSPSVDAAQAMREMVNPQEADEALKGRFAPAIIDKNREILNWKTDVFDKISVEGREERVECIQNYLVIFGDPNEREIVAKYLRIAGCGESLVEAAEEAIGRYSWLIEMDQSQKQKTIAKQPVGKTANKIVRERVKTGSRLQPFVYYVVPAAVCLGVALVYYLVSKHRR